MMSKNVCSVNITLLSEPRANSHIPLPDPHPHPNYIHTVPVPYHRHKKGCSKEHLDRDG